ncbi:uncharacterized protein LOC143579201 [Bidens hawaiensis]|uniref:uncharacterized protein LOC143579201 n=1 Tax=Bidens hawaiensis TaxID=980011 RepID=UPI004049123E
MRCIDEAKQVGLRDAYKKAKKEEKKVVLEAKSTSYKRMYERLETNEGEHHMFKIAKARERKRQDLEAVKFIKGEDGRVLVKEQDIKLKWQTYFHGLFNNGRAYHGENENTTTQIQQWNICYCRRITPIDGKGKGGWPRQHTHRSVEMFGRGRSLMFN